MDDGGGGDVYTIPEFYFFCVRFCQRNYFENADGVQDVQGMKLIRENSYRKPHKMKGDANKNAKHLFAAFVCTVTVGIG